jgi:hypothetical protein
LTSAVDSLSAYGRGASSGTREGHMRKSGLQSNGDENQVELKKKLRPRKKRL